MDENLDTGGEKKPLTAKGVGDAILGYLSGSVVPMIPVIMAAGLLKTIGVVLGPTMLNVVADDSNVITLFDFLYNAAFYFMPIYVGFNAASKLGVTQMLGAYMGGILIAPAFIAMASEGATFDVFGIPCIVGDYSSSVVPVLLSVWVMSYVEKFFKRVLPDALTTVFCPFLTMFVMTPISLCALAPLGGLLGSVIGNALFAIGSMGGVISVLGGAIMAALWLPLVATGMHLTVIMLALSSFLTSGVDNFVLVCATIGLWGTYGAEVGAFLRIKNRDEKSEAMGYVISNMIGGVGEPFIYGMLFKRPRLWLTSCAGSGAAGLVAVALGVCCYNMSASNVLNILAFISPDSSSNLVNACIAAAVGFAVSLVLTYLFGFTKEEIEGKQAA